MLFYLSRGAAAGWGGGGVINRGVSAFPPSLRAPQAQRCCLRLDTGLSSRKSPFLSPKLGREVQSHTEHPRVFPFLNTPPPPPHHLPPLPPPPSLQTHTEHHHPQPHSPGSCRIWSNAGSLLSSWRCRGLPDLNAVFSPPLTTTTPSLTSLPSPPRSIHTHRVQGSVGDVFFPPPPSLSLRGCRRFFKSMVQCPAVLRPLPRAPHRPPRSTPCHRFPNFPLLSFPPSSLSLPPPTPPRGYPPFPLFPRAKGILGTIARVQQLLLIFQADKRASSFFFFFYIAFFFPLPTSFHLKGTSAFLPTPPPPPNSNTFPSSLRGHSFSPVLPRWERKSVQSEELCPPTPAHARSLCLLFFNSSPFLSPNPPSGR